VTLAAWAKDYGPSAILIVLCLAAGLLLVVGTAQGANVTWRPTATSTLAPINDTTAQMFIDALGGNETYNATAGTGGIDWRGFVSSPWAAYVAVLGNLAAVIAFAIPIAMIWIRTRDITYVAGVGAVFGLFAFTLLPADFRMAGIAGIGIGVLAALFSLYKEGRG